MNWHMLLRKWLEMYAVPCLLEGIDREHSCSLGLHPAVTRRQTGLAWGVHTRLPWGWTHTTRRGMGGPPRGTRGYASGKEPGSSDVSTLRKRGETALQPWRACSPVCTLRTSLLPGTRGADEDRRTGSPRPYRPLHAGDFHIAPIGSRVQHPIFSRAVSTLETSSQQATKPAEKFLLT
jgi:hypothetical protein